MSSRIYITQEDPASLSSGWDLTAKSQVGSPAHLVTDAWLRPLTADRAITGALLCHQGCRPRSLCTGSGRRASGLHVAKTTPTLPWANFVTSLFLTRTLPRARRHGLPSWAGPLLLVHSGYFQILGDVPLPLHLIGPRCPPPPSTSLLLAVRKPHYRPAWGLLTWELPPLCSP